MTDTNKTLTVNSSNTDRETLVPLLISLLLISTGITLLLISGVTIFGIEIAVSNSDSDLLRAFGFNALIGALISLLTAPFIRGTAVQSDLSAADKAQLQRTRNAAVTSAVGIWLSVSATANMIIVGYSSVLLWLAIVGAVIMMTGVFLSTDHSDHTETALVGT